MQSNESLTTHLLNRALRFHLEFEAAVKDLCKELDDAGFEAETKAFIEMLAEDGCEKVGPADVREYLRWKEDDVWLDRPHHRKARPVI